MFWFIVLLLVVGAGFYFYQKMMAIEGEIRAEQGAEKEHISQAQGPEKVVDVSIQTTAHEIENSSVAAIPDLTTIEEAIFSAVKKNPGMKQTDLYPLFVGSGKKQLQKVIKNMSDNGILRREKRGSSYLLYHV